MEGSTEEEEISLEQEFAQSTSIHGLARISDKSKSTWLRLAWFVAFAACMGGCAWQIYQRVHAYIQYDVNTKVSRVYKSELEFPAVTICNFNRYRASQITDEDLPFIEFVLFAEEYDYDSYADDGRFDQASFDFDAFIGNGTFDYTEFTLRTGFVLDDDTLIECKWRGRKCYAKNFTHVFTSFGNCWTFNSGEDENGKDLTILKEDQPGSGNGLKVTIDIQQEEYTEKLSGNSQAGLKVLIHDQADPPLMDSLGSAIPPGYYAFTGVRREEFQNQGRPWGMCDKTVVLQHYDEYTLSGCFIECRLALIIKDCECRPVRYPGNAAVCSPLKTSTCVKDVLRRFKAGSLGTCNCPVPCQYTVFTTAISYGAIPSLSVADEAAAYFNVSAEYQRRNLVVLDIFYEELNLQSYQENKALTISSLISDIGGNLGLFLGGSILTFAEFIEYILMKCSGICRSGKKRRPASPTTTTTGKVWNFPQTGPTFDTGSYPSVRAVHNPRRTTTGF